MRFCASCGKQIEEDSMFCNYCGAPTRPQANRKEQVAPAPQYKANERTSWSQGNVPAEYKPISMWGYFGYELLFMIPCVGIILLLVFAFGGTQNVNLKNFARSYFCMFIVVAILVLIFMLWFGAYASSFYNYYY